MVSDKWMDNAFVLKSKNLMNLPRNVSNFALTEIKNGLMAGATVVKANLETKMDIAIHPVMLLK